MLLESVDLVVAALVAGAAAGTGEVATAAVRDAYEGLKSLTRKALGHSPADADEEERAGLEMELAAPEAHRAELKQALSSSEVEVDAELVTAAQRVLTLVDPEGAAAGKYANMVVQDNKGVQVGDHNTQTNSFGS
ncbi:hypothetical protein SK854_03855 [Lentzea sp. BCCO 10_0061]|uniref:RHIM domain-containing protein n=1 Tax=Lentzea sokolovensis TaxID=3095429 RepID=A0ABU4UP13_9PSEU|nr:hypothetical protein [Lentzea sp. BCCO 10_0061]MDX8141232.1 hypothetical protein [Lentzea sp. BCCO 10_0061]